MHGSGFVSTLVVSVTNLIKPLLGVLGADSPVGGGLQAQSSQQHKSQGCTPKPLLCWSPACMVGPGGMFVHA